MSWRDSTPQKIQTELDQVLERAFQVIEDVLRDLPAILPFAVQAGRDGTASLVLPDPAENEASPASSKLMADIMAILTERAPTLRAFATATPVEIEGGDGVCVEWEHRDGGPGLMLLRKYTSTRTGVPVAWGDSQARTVEKRLF